MLNLVQRDKKRLLPVTSLYAVGYAWKCRDKRIDMLVPFDIILAAGTAETIHSLAASVKGESVNYKQCEDAQKA